MCILEFRKSMLTVGTSDSWLGAAPSRGRGMSEGGQAGEEGPGLALPAGVQEAPGVGLA